MRRRPGEIYPLLERLVRRSDVVLLIEGDRYALSMKLFGLAHRYARLSRLVAPGQSLMSAFAREAWQSCHPVGLEGDAAVVVPQASYPGNWVFCLRVGASLDLLETGSGRILLACLDVERRQERLSRLGCSRKKAMGPERDADLDLYRRQGFRVGPSRQVHGFDDLSEAIVGAQGQGLTVLACPYVRRIDDAQPSIAKTLGQIMSIAARLSPA